MAAVLTITDTGVDTGVATTTTTQIPLDNKEKFITVYVVQASGDCAGGVLTVQCSADNSVWFNTGDTITLSSGFSLATSFGPFAAKHARLIVSTASSIASTADIVVQAK